MRTTRAWANPIERTCLAIDKYDSECDRFIGRVVAGTLASSQAWEPTDERAIPKEWALEKGQWFTCKETGYDVFVPYPRITYSVKRWSCYHRDKVLVKGLDSKEEALSKMLEIRSSEKSPDIFVYADMEGMDVSLKVG